MLPEGLSMLWESIDAEAALRDRFGFDGLGSVSRWIRQIVGPAWQLQIDACTRLVISDRNAIAWVTTDAGPRIVKWSAASDHFDPLATTARLIGDVGDRGVPVAAPCPTADGARRAVLLGPAGPLSVLVQPELDGTWLDVGDLDAVRDAGACLARLHEALRSCDPAGLGVSGHAVLDVDDPASTVRAWLDARDPGYVPSASRRLREMLDGLPPLQDSPQLIHLDYRAANILTSGSKVVGILDFDDMGWGFRVDDLAQSSIVLATLFHDWGPTPPAAREALREGYESVRALSAAESAWLELLTLWYGLRFVPGPDDPAGWAAAL